jgi:predicted secreted protein
VTKHFEVIDGIDFPPNQRREPGQTVTSDELPDTSVSWLLESGHIKQIKSPKPTPKPAKESD